MTHLTPVPAAPRRACTIRNGSVRFAERTVLTGIDLSIGPTERIAIIGDNGAGKSTLLRAVAGSVPLSSGERQVTIPGGISLAEQHPEFPPNATVAEALDALLAEIRGLESQLADLYTRLSDAPAAEQQALLEQIATVIDQLEARDAYGMEQRLDSALDKLGLGGLDRARPVRSLSGGERARLALAAALSSEAELLLLDEPTNDLDDAAIVWLEDRLATHRGALLIVTHDRAFLDRFATDILHLEHGSVRRYGDGYSGFLKAKAAERQRLLELHEDWQQELARNRQLVVSNAFRLDAIPRKMERAAFGHGAFRARGRDHGAMGRIRIAKQRVARLLDEPAEKPAEPLRFTPPDHSSVSIAATDAEPLISVEDVCVGADGDGPQLFLARLEIAAGERVLVTGPNGAGKTTLLRVLAGELDVDRGLVRRREDLRVSWLRQELSLTGSRSLLEAFASATHDYLDAAADRLLSFGLFGLEDLERPIGLLSIGMRRRYEVAVALAAPSDLLLLDEPTNHLAPELVEQFEEALETYEGAVVTVTHDRKWRARAELDLSTLQLRVQDGIVCGPDS